MEKNRKNTRRFLCELEAMRTVYKEKMTSAVTHSTPGLVPSFASFLTNEKVVYL